MAKTLGETLADARHARGWSLRDVQKRTDIHNAHLSQIEKGVITRPDPHMLWTLATVYDLDYQELMRLAHHVGRQSTNAKRRSVMGMALYALDDLTYEEQQQVLDYMSKLRKRREGD
jgi:transcriptional regulator with XRE-family HTH domain